LSRLYSGERRYNGGYNEYCCAQSDHENHPRYAVPVTVKKSGSDVKSNRKNMRDVIGKTGVASTERIFRRRGLLATPGVTGKS